MQIRDGAGSLGQGGCFPPVVREGICQNQRTGRHRTLWEYSHSFRNWGSKRVISSFQRTSELKVTVTWLPGYSDQSHKNTSCFVPLFNVSHWLHQSEILKINMLAKQRSTQSSCTYEVYTFCWFWGSEDSLRINARFLCSSLVPLAPVVDSQSSLTSLLPSTVFSPLAPPFPQGTPPLETVTNSLSSFHTTVLINKLNSLESSNHHP